MLSTSPQRHGGESPPDSWVSQVCCISPNPSILQQLTPLLAECFPRAAVARIRNYPASGTLAHEVQSRIPQVCLIDVISDPVLALTLIPEVLNLDKKISIIVLLAASESDLILKCLRLGASEFLLQPFSADQLMAALPTLALASREAGDPNPTGKVYCVLPAKGACGSSTVACNLAFQFKRSGAKRILLADLDPLTGTLSFLLKIKSPYSFVDVLHRAESLDADLWRGMVTAVNGVDVLLAPELLQGADEIREARPIADFARKNYDVVLLDAGNPFGPWGLSVARESDSILLVTTNELPALHGAQRVLAYLDMNDIPKRKLRIIINRFDRQVGLTQEAIESALHLEVVEAIPSDFDTVQKALIEGKPILPATGLGKVFATLADKLEGRVKETPSRSPRSGLLSLFSRTSS